MDFPFSALLSSPNVKRAKGPLRINAHAPNKTPLIIHIPTIYSLYDAWGTDFLKALRDAIDGTALDILIISTTDQEPKICYDCTQSDFRHVESSSAMEDAGYVQAKYKIPLSRNRHKHAKKNCPTKSAVLWVIGTNLRKEAICMASVSSPSQRNLFVTHKKLEESYEQENIRLLQRSIRQLSVELRDLSIVQPFADWGFSAGTPTQEKLAKQELTENEVADFICALKQDSKEEYVKEAILGIGRREKALDDWCDSFKDEAMASKWSTFPTRAQDTIKQIERNDELKWEQRFISLLINPNDVEEGWSQIALEPDVKEAIVKLVHQASNTGMQDYGILKRSRVGGALLYGPPGSGKTHLARVLVRESKAITICASAAEIENKYLGETEKAIQGLFSLGRMLFPCIIFIDEADALFRLRKSDERGWERSRMNQFLYEIDGLKKSKSSPFVLLATNFPLEIDHAILRRVPSRIYIGLPSPEARQQIFQICLVDEMLHPDVNLQNLVEKSRGYSGSDIQTVCVQAALVCDTIVSDNDTRRLLKQRHFEKAFQRSAPTVSKMALAEIRKFAKEFDPAALTFMGQEENTIHMSSKLSSFRNEEHKSTRVRNDQPRKQGEAPLSQPIGLDPDSNSARHEQSTASSRRVEEVKSQANEAGLGELEERYQYTPLKPNSDQIRVLFIQPKKSSSDITNNDLLRCTLSTVDLDDWTINYREFSSSYKAAGLPILPVYRLTHWHYQSAFREGLRNSKYSGSNDFYDKRSYEFCARLSVNNDLPFEGIEVIDQRFNWGDYIALSYVWGDPTNRRDILLNGHRFSVTANLYEALIHLRDSFEVRQMKYHVWADAICINQDDLAERAAEVKKMSMIYSRCLSVRAWLGHPSPEFTLELPTIREFLSSISDIKVCDINYAEQMNTIPVTGAADSLMIIGFSLFSTSYWERLWTIQELALAPSILFYLGKEVFTTEELFKLSYLTTKGMVAMENLFEFTHVYTILLHACYRLLRLRLPYDGSLSYDSYLLEKSQLPITDLVIFAQNSKAMDQRDKVFGLLALLPESVAARINPSYDQSFSIQDAFTMLSKALFAAEGNLCHLARVKKQPTINPNLPSWVLDLEAEPDMRTNTVTGVSHRIHRANLDMTMKELSFSENNRSLFCDGVIVDAVASLGTVLVRSFKRRFDRFDRFPAGQIGSDRSSAAIAGCDWKLALARVLIQDGSFKFSDSPSVLDIPWVEQDEVNYKAVMEDSPYFQFSKKGPCRLQFSPLLLLKTAFECSLYGNENFDIGGKPLRSYFTSRDPICPNSIEFRCLARDLSVGLNGNRLFTSQAGLLGTATQYARLGDQIAVLSGCDMPMVLRANGGHYEVVGSCFVEGLMNGETARGIKQGRFQVESFSLC